MRILWVKAGGLVPPDSGGRIRSYHILRQLALRHEVTFASFYAAHPNDQHPALGSVFEGAWCYPLSLPKPHATTEKLHYLAKSCSSLLPYSIGKYQADEIKSDLRRRIRSRKFDVIVCDFLAGGANLPWDIDIPIVLFTHNVETTIWRRHFEVAKSPLWKAIFWREWKTMSRTERWMLRSAQHIVAVSEADKVQFSNVIPASKISVIPTGVDVDYFSPGKSEEIKNSLVFTGSMDWMANEDAVLYFARQVFPLIRKKKPDAQFSIVGRNPTKLVQELADPGAGIVVTGVVPDIRTYLNQNSVVVVPIRVGSGTRLKIFEAMASGRTVLSTTVGAEGLPVTDRQDIVLADTPEAFANAALWLLEDAKTRQRLGRAARQLVEARYSWAIVTRIFESVLSGTTFQGEPRVQD